MNKNFNIWRDVGCLNAFIIYCILCFLFYGLFEWDSEMSAFAALGIPLLLLYISYRNNQVSSNTKNQNTRSNRTKKKKSKNQGIMSAFKSNWTEKNEDSNFN